MLASQYGWSKREIWFETYPDELFELADKIKSRKISDLKMQLAIVQNPHTKEPKELWQILEGAEPIKEKLQTEPKFDAAGFERLKAVMGENPRFEIKS